MGFIEWLKGDSPEERERKRKLREQQQRLREEQALRQQEDLIALERGGIPHMAKERLEELANQANSENGLVFTSDLAPDELALLRRHGYRARGLVTGSCMYHVGTIYVNGWRDSEAPALSMAYDEATRLAVSRLRQEARAIGAHGVIGVRLRLVRHEWSEKCIEVQLVGTAIEGPEPPVQPWLSDLSAQEWFALHRAGYEPAGFVWGHSAWFIFTTAFDEQLCKPAGFLNAQPNQEIWHFSEALSTARQLAMNTVYSQLNALAASGIVGVKIERRLDEVRLSGVGVSEDAREREHHNLLISVIGTAIRPSLKPPKPIQATVPLLSLRDGRIKPAVVVAGPTLSVED